MAIDVDVLDIMVRNDLHEAGYTDKQIAEMSIGECFEAWLVWNGIMGFGDGIRKALFSIGAASEETLIATDKAKEDFARKYYFGMHTDRRI